jgi:ferrous iron transport protein B
MKKTRTIAIAGNPNAGKTSVFNALTGGRQHVANYPGITVEYEEGSSIFDGEKVKVIDLPGTYSLTAYSPEEVVARDYIIEKSPDIIINVVDASNLERNLYLTVQLITLKVPIVIALNMVDTAKLHGIEIEYKRMEEIFGVKVVPTIASKGKGFDKLKTACIETMNAQSLAKPLPWAHELCESLFPLEEKIESFAKLPKRYPSKWAALKLLEEDPIVIELLKKNPAAEKIFPVLSESKKRLEMHSGEDSRTAVIEAYYAISAGACRECIKMSGDQKRLLSDKIDSIVCNRFLGPLILFGIVYFIFTAIFNIADELKWIPLPRGSFVSPTELFEMGCDFLKNIVNSHIANDFLRSLLSDGIISGVGGVLSFVPLIFFMFIFLAAIEDTGYMARIAFILDRVLRIFGLQGKSILPLLLAGGIGGGGCAVPAVMSTRTMREEKDRLVTILVLPMMNCGAKFPIYAVLIAAFFQNLKSQMMFLIWFLSWIFTLTSAFFLRKFVVKGEQTPFVMELPVYHIPTLKGIFIHTWARTSMYIKKAGTIILLVNLLLWIVMTFPRVNGSPTEKLNASLAGRVSKVLLPISSLAGFGLRENIALVGGFAAKEVIVSTMGTAYSIGDISSEAAEPLSQKLAASPDWNRLKAFAMIVFIMVYAPCLATIASIKKETHSWKWAVFSTVYSTAFAYLLAVIIYQSGKVFLQI